MIGDLFDVGMNLWSLDDQRDQQRQARDFLLEGVDKSRDIYQQNYDRNQGAYDPYIQGGQEAWQNLLGMQESMGVENFQRPEMGDFQFDGQVEDYLNPYMDFALDQGNRNIEQSAVARGGLYSGDTMKDLQSHAIGLGQQNYGNAVNQMQTDKNFAYNQFLNKFNSTQQNINDRYAKMQDQYNRLSGISNVGLQGVGAEIGTGNQFAGQMAGLQGNESNVRAQGAQIPTFVQDLASQSGKIGGMIDSGVAMAMGVPPVGGGDVQSTQPQQYAQGYGISQPAQQQYGIQNPYQNWNL
jgi:hypothetical protein